MSAVPAMPYLPEHEFDVEACRIRPITPVATAPAVARKFAIVEQMGHRRFGAEVREVEFCGAKLLECVLVTEPPVVLQIHPQSLYAITQCSEDQARKVNTPWGLPSEVRALLPSPEPEPVVIETPPWTALRDLALRLGRPMSGDELRAAVIHLRACFEAHGNTETENDEDDEYASNVLIALEEHVGIASPRMDDNDESGDEDDGIPFQ